MYRKITVSIGLAAGLWISQADATTAFTGEVWENTLAGGNAALAPTGEHATFGVDAINGAVDVDTNPATYTVADFLATFPGFNGFGNQSAGFDPNAILSAAGLNTAGPNPGTFFQFTGPVALTPGSNSFTATHDDGLIASLAGFGTVLNSAGPTSPRTDTFTINNTTGVSSAVLTADYGECCLGTAVLETDFLAASPPRTVPEPGSAGILLAGLIGLATTVWCRKPHLPRSGAV